MRSVTGTTTAPVRLSDLVATLSLVADLGMGRPMERVLRHSEYGFAPAGLLAGITFAHALPRASLEETTKKSLPAIFNPISPH